MLQNSGLDYNPRLAKKVGSLSRFRLSHIYGNHLNLKPFLLSFLVDHLLYRGTIYYSCIKIRYMVIAIIVNTKDEIRLQYLSAIMAELLLGMVHCSGV